MKKLVIISHTEHQLNAQHQPVGWAPTVREINYLAGHWDQLVHIACLDNATPLGSSVAYNQDNIRFVPIPAFGGKHVWQKLTTFLKIPGILWKVHRSLKEATEVQIRLPMGIGLFLIAYFKFFRSNRYTLWIKYAGDWGTPSTSTSSRLQQSLLVRQWLNCKVTINGMWPNQPDHCYSFNNPCITAEQFADGEKYIQTKSLTGPYDLIFVGRLEEKKGIDILINTLDESLKNKIACFHVVGDGPLLEPLREQLTRLGIQHVMHGFMPQQEIVRLYQQAHFLLLPSRTEGFPKVVAEALNYGCLPIVSQVGSIPHVIKEDENGFLMPEITVDGLRNAWVKAMGISPNQMLNMRNNGRLLAKAFTYDAYLNDLKTQIFNA